MRWIIKPEGPHPDLIRVKFAFLPRLLYFEGKWYRIWFERYYIKLVWKDTAWAKGYRIESEWPYFTKRRKRQT